MLISSGLKLHFGGNCKSVIASGWPTYSVRVIFFIFGFILLGILFISLL